MHIGLKDLVPSFSPWLIHINVMEICIIATIYFGPLSDSGPMILPQTFCDVIVEAIFLSFCFIFVRFFVSMGIVTSLANKGLANKG